MYKTIRHGENSLQYTILPQNDDYRNGGGNVNINNNNNNGNIIAGVGEGGEVGVDGSTDTKFHGTMNSGKNRKKKNIMAYIGLFFVCSIITGAILLPLMVSIEFMANPTSWFLNKTHPTQLQLQQQPQQLQTTKQPLIKELMNLTKILISIDKQSSINNNDNKTDSDNFTTTSSSPSFVESVDKSTTINAYPMLNTSTIESSSDELKQQPTSITSPPILIEKSLKSSSSSSSSSSYVNEKYPNNIILSIEEVLTDHNIINELSTNNPPIDKQYLIQNLAPLSNKKTIMNTDASTIETTNIVLTTDINSTSTINSFTEQNKIINNNINNSDNNNNNNNINKSKNKFEDDNIDSVRIEKNNKSWIKSHWPFVDSSTYFQWTDYESEDNILLPAIFGAAILAVILFILLCIVLKNKNCILCSNRRNRNEFLNVEGQDGDNATLLTNENVSEEE